MLNAHLLHRERITCPLLASAHAGNEAAARLADVKAAKDNDLPFYQAIEQIMLQPHGSNVMAILVGDPEAPGLVTKAREKMAAIWADYERAVRAEHCLIGLAKLEREAA